MMYPEKDTESGQSSADARVRPSSIAIRPDGGLEAWMVVVGAWGSSFCSWGWINSKFLFQNGMAETNNEQVWESSKNTMKKTFSGSTLPAKYLGSYVWKPFSC